MGNGFDKHKAQFIWPEVELVNKTICIIVSDLFTAICEHNWKQADVVGNRSFPKKQICCTTEHEDWSNACAIKNQHLSTVVSAKVMLAACNYRNGFLVLQKQKGQNRNIGKEFMWLCITEKKTLKNLEP